MSFSPVLTLKRQFDPDKGQETEILVVNQMQTDDGQQKFVKANQKIWKFQGTNVR